MHAHTLHTQTHTHTHTNTHSFTYTAHIHTHTNIYMWTLVCRASIRAFGYLRLLIETMLTTVDSSKNRVLCCTGRSWWHCCPPRIPQREDIVGLEELSQQSTPESCDGEDEFERLRSYLPFTVLNPRRRNSEHALHLIRSIRECMGGALETDKQPLMFMPGRILHLEEPDQYST